VSSRDKASTFEGDGFLTSMKEKIVQPTKEKTLAVSYQWDGRNQAPTVRLRGRILKQIGCVVGSRVEVTIDSAGERITLRRIAGS
jgi:hypothetical protein